MYVAMAVLATGTCLIMYGQESDNSGGTHSAQITCLTLLMWMLPLKRLLRPAAPIYRPSHTIVFYSLYFIWGCVTTLFSEMGRVETGDVIYHFAWTLLPFFVLGVTYYYILSHGASRAMLWAFMLTTVLFLVTYASMYDTDNLLNNIHLGSSYYALFMLPLVMCFPNKLVRYGGVLIVAVAVFSSAKRGGVLALLGGTLAYVVVSQRVSKQSALVKFFIMVLVLALLTWVFIVMGTAGDNDVFERFENIDQDNGSGRTLVWAEVMRLIHHEDAQAYIFGNGYNTVVEASRLGLSAHNDYLEAWYDYGFIGLLLYIVSVVSLMFSTLRAVVKRYRYAAAMSMNMVNIVVLSMISHIAIYYWMNMVMLCVAFFVGDMGYEQMHPHETEAETNSATNSGGEAATA